MPVSNEIEINFFEFWNDVMMMEFKDLESF